MEPEREVSSRTAAFAKDQSQSRSFDKVGGRIQGEDLRLTGGQFRSGGGSMFISEKTTLPAWEANVCREVR
jgi:hypothetical protein